MSNKPTNSAKYPPASHRNSRQTQKPDEMNQLPRSTAKGVVREHMFPTQRRSTVPTTQLCRWWLRKSEKLAKPVTDVLSAPQNQSLRSGTETHWPTAPSKPHLEIECGRVARLSGGSQAIKSTQIRPAEAMLLPQELMTRLNSSTIELDCRASAQE